MRKVSFDFDGTLSLNMVQEVAHELRDKGYDIWIVTARCPQGSNQDLQNIAKNLWANVKYMCFEDKFKFLKDKDFLFHLDDDVIELNMIESFTKVIPICHMDWGMKYGGKENWKKIINDLTNG